MNESGAEGAWPSRDKGLTPGEQDISPGLALFLVRECGLQHLDTLRAILERHGFDLLCDAPIELERWSDVAEEPPGSDGQSAHFFVAHDVYPELSPASNEETGTAAMLFNARVCVAEEQMRREVNRRLPRAQRCDLVQAFASAKLALEQLAALEPKQIPFVLAAARERDGAFVTPYPVLADLSKHARRAKIELIDFHGTRAVCKTFRPGRERFMEREIQARELGKSIPEVSRILEVGSSYLVFEWYDNRLKEILGPELPFCPHGLLPLWTLDRVRYIILHYRRLGYECIDFNPHNLIYDSCKGLKIIDFEYLQPSHEASNRLKGNYAWYPVPLSFSGDRPEKLNCRSYLRRWLPYTGLPRVMCLYPFPRSMLRVVRRGMFVALSLAGAGRMAKRRVRHLLHRWSEFS